jgi:3-hydroxyacyl-CoA dehydrogenase/enoyl-CoA hydratase/3-hydroxybutyryl-CoA epimerase/3-hydroxyacyl-CoA dehydrogenase/enoyl-CoA hydratase/3-hydroxybutyryl-CoA epimerase/enoyl-CoA isomerase
LEQRTYVRVVLFMSGKPGQFVAGADLNELAAMSYAKPEQVAGLIASGHQLFSRLSKLPFPMVALIDGGCLGGGTELVLTMDERLVSTAPHTQISLPEVQLGILPGWGGTSDYRV